MLFEIRVNADMGENKRSTTAERHATTPAGLSDGVCAWRIVCVTAPRIHRIAMEGENSFTTVSLNCYRVAKTLSTDPEAQ